MELTLYELLGLIKDNKAPKKIRRNGNDYEFSIIDGDIDYIAIDKETGVKCYLSDVIGDNYLGFIFSTTVEVLEEEKEIEEIDMCTSGIMGFDGVENITSALKDKINELVREVNKIKKEGK